MNAKFAETGLADYEALIYRAQAILDYDDQSGLDRNVLRHSLAMLLGDDLNRIIRTEFRLSHRLAGSPDLLAELSYHTENGMAETLSGPMAVETDDPNTPVNHTTDEAVAVARMLFPILNLQAMRKIEEEIMGRPRHDPAWENYIDALLNLHAQTVSCQRRLDDKPIPAKRMARLGVRHLGQQSDEARQLSAQIAKRHQGKTLWGIIATSTAVCDQLAKQAVPDESGAELPYRTLSPAEMRTICRAAAIAINAMIELINRWETVECSSAARSGAMIARHYGQQTLSRAEELDEDSIDEDEREDVIDMEAAVAELEQTMQPIMDSGMGRRIPATETWTEREADAHRSHAAAAAVHGHTVALNALLNRIVAHKNDDEGLAIATAVWVNENIIRRAVEVEPPDDVESASIWEAAQAALEELDAEETTAARVVAALRPCRLSPALRSPLMAEEVAEAMSANRYSGGRDTLVIQVEDDRPPEEWIFTYQYQGALHAKMLGEPYNHKMDPLVVLEHMDYVERLAYPDTRWIEPEFRNDLRDIAARTRELAALGLHYTPEALFRMTINRMFALTGRTHAVHAVIDVMTGNRPSASRYLKNVHHSGSHFLHPDQCAAIVEAASAAGVLPTDVTELCHRLGLPEETMDEMDVPQRYQVPEELALDPVAMIIRLGGRLADDAAEEAAYQLGWNEELVHKARLLDRDEEDD